MRCPNFGGFGPLGDSTPPTSEVHPGFERRKERALEPELVQGPKSASDGAREVPTISGQPIKEEGPRSQSEREGGSDTDTETRDPQHTRPTPSKRRSTLQGHKDSVIRRGARPLEDTSAARVGHMYGKVSHSPPLFRGRLCAARSRVGTALRGFLGGGFRLALLFGNTPGIGRKPP